MTVKEFIEKATEGGWDSKNIFIKGLAPDWIAVHARQMVFEMFLDPKAWQAVGKTEKWGSGNGCAICEEGMMDPMFDWQKNMYLMVGSLIEGKTVEQFLETL